MKSLKTIAPIIVALVAVGLFWSNCSRDMTTREESLMSHYSKDQARDLAATVAHLTGGQTSMIAGTGSMGGIIADPAYVVVVREYAALKAGYVAIYLADGKRIIHRVAYAIGDTWKMKGDANADYDPRLMTKSNYVGTVVATIPYDPEL